MKVLFFLILLLCVVSSPKYFTSGSPKGSNNQLVFSACWQFSFRAERHSPREARGEFGCVYILVISIVGWKSVAGLPFEDTEESRVFEISCSLCVLSVSTNYQLQMASSTVNKKVYGGGSALRTGGIVGAVVPPKKKVDNFPLMSYVANNCSFSDKGEDSQEDEEVLKSYNDQRVNELLREAAKRSNAVSSDDSEDRKKALELLHSMEWSKNQEETWKVVKPKKETDYGGFLHALKPKRNEKEDEYFSGCNKVKKPKERKRSRSVSEVVFLENGKLVAKNNPSHELPIQLNHPPPPRPVTPRVPSYGLPFTPGPPPSTANNPWLQKSGSTLFSDVRSNTIVAYGINCDEDEAMAMAIAESIRTAKQEQERIMHFVNPSSGLTLPKSNDVPTVQVQSIKPIAAYCEDKENYQTAVTKTQSSEQAAALPARVMSGNLTQDQYADTDNSSWGKTKMETKSPNLSQRSKYADTQIPTKPRENYQTTVIKTQCSEEAAAKINNALPARVISENLAQDQCADADDSSWGDTKMETKRPNSSVRSKSADCAQIPPKPLIYLTTTTDHADQKKNITSDLGNKETKYSDSWNSAEQKHLDSLPQSSEISAFKKMLMNHQTNEEMDCKTPMNTSFDSKKITSAREESTVKCYDAQKVDDGKTSSGINHGPMPFSLTMSQTTNSVQKLGLKPDHISDKAAITNKISEAKQLRYERESINPEENQYLRTTSLNTKNHDNELATSAEDSSHSSISRPSRLPTSMPSLMSSVKPSIQTSMETKPQVTDPSVNGRRHTSFVIHSEIPGKPSSTRPPTWSPADQVDLSAGAVLEPPPIQTVEQTMLKELPQNKVSPSPAQQAQQVQPPYQQPSIPPVLPSLNPLASMAPNKLPEMPQAQDMANLMAAQIQMQMQMMLMQQSMGFIPPVLPTDQNMAGVNKTQQQSQCGAQNQIQTGNNISFPGSLNPSLGGVNGLPSANVPGYPVGHLGGIPGLPNLLPPSLPNSLQANMLGLPNGFPTGFPMMPNPMPGAQTGLPPMPGLLNNYPNNMLGLQGNQAGFQNMVPPDPLGSMNAFSNGFPGHLGYPNIMPGMQTHQNKPSIPGMINGNSFNGMASFVEPGNVPLVSGKGRGRLARNLDS
ncbi:uncharacterized protein LOC113202520 isoform X2 [Frankliniella occidentalis]|uniref:Uncharacterized protein LOC113202520 isoform X2 n=1 Tax=Frankliniella occidentalis TaxID=133901 RepID=A0A6J1RUL1_FRAOC|nr:uncharacterized protein LOC113202520 isoform X2 [Frankliniella occidentalis]